MSLFKKRHPKKDVETSIEVYGLDPKDQDKRILLDTIDIIDEGQSEEENDVIKLVIEKNNLDDMQELTDMEMSDMAMMKELRDTYPDKKDMKSFIMDACASYKKPDAEDKDNPDLTDEEIKKKKELEDSALDKEKKLVGKLNKAEYSKILADSANKTVDEFDRQQKIEEAAQARFDAAKEK